MKKFIGFFLAVVFLFSLCACGADHADQAGTSSTSTLSSASPAEDASHFEGEITLDFAFGTRTGQYEGDVNEAGVPDGYGVFTAVNTTGTSWTYEGDWVNGHWEGLGTSTWSDGQKYVGNYSEDVEAGDGTYFFADGSSFAGVFTDGNADGVYTAADGVQYYATMVDGSVEIGGIWRTGEFGDEIDAYQGEWSEIDNRYGRLVISGESINFISEMEIGSKHSVDVNTFYFGKNENGDLVVVNESGSYRYDISIGEDDVLTITQDSKERKYEKVSDSLEIPKETYEPEIGMTEIEIYGSTWGAPEKKNKTTTAGGESEQWVYEDGYIYFTDGIVTAIQER